MPGLPSHAAPIPARTWVQLITVTLIWGSTWLVIKSQLGVVPVAWSVAYRFITAAAIMLAYCLVTRRSMRIGPPGHLLAAAVAVCQFLLNFNLVYRAEEHVTSGVVAVVFALLVVPNALFARLILGHPVTARFAVGSALGIGGVAMLFRHELTMTRASDSGVMLGLALTLAAVLVASLANVMQGTATAAALSVRGLLAVILLYAAVIDTAFALAVAGPPVIDPTPLYIGGFVYLGAVASALAFNLYYDAIRAIGPGRAAYTSLVVPFIAMGLSTVFEGYRWTLLAVAGAALAVLGLYVALSSRR